MLRRLKNYLRRRAMVRCGLAPQVSAATFSAGERSGVWTVLPELLGPESVVYSFGVGNNLAWDQAMVERFRLTLHAFDPTPASVTWVRQQRLPANLHFHAIGLADQDGILDFSLPRHGSRFNFRPGIRSAVPGWTTIEAPVNRLSTIMRQLGHEHLDVLKLDIEGGEYDALDDLLTNRIDVRQILVEFHHHLDNLGIERTHRAARALQAAGYQAFHLSERGLEIGLVSRAALRDSSIVRRNARAKPVATC